MAILAFCWSSDYFNERSYHLAAASALAIVCFAVILGVTNNTGRYVLLCFGVAGVYAACPLVSTDPKFAKQYRSCTDIVEKSKVSIYVSNAIPHPSEKRAIVQATVNALGNNASIYGSFLFLKNSTNHHRTGFAVTMAFMIIAFIMAFVLKYTLAKFPYPALQTAHAQEVSSAQEEHRETDSKA